MAKTQTATCMLCEAVCGLELTIDADKLVRVEGDRHDTFSRGHICPKAAGLDDIRNDPDRVLYPQRRNKSGEFTRITWDEAMTEAAERLGEILETHGRHAVATYVGNPLAHSYGGILGSIVLAQSMGSFSRFSATSADQLPQMLASFEMLGHQALLPVPDLDRTNFLLVIGGNPLVSNGSIMTAPGIKRRLSELRARGGRVVVIDPRRTETAEVADQHFSIRPGTDAFLLFAMIHTIFEAGLANLRALRAVTRGVHELREAAAQFPPEAVAEVTGITADDIRRLAIDYARADGAACYPRVGACTQEFGGLCAWLAMALDVITGNLDRPGGKMFATPAIDLVNLATKLGMRGSFARFKSRVRGLPEFGGELPVATLAEEIETPGDDRIRALVTMAGNPVVSAPNGFAVDRALGKLDFMVSIDLYKNETTRHASIILPPTFGLERDHYDMVLYAFAVHNHARYAKAAFTPRGETRDDWDIITDLAHRISKRGPASAKSLAKRLFLAGLRTIGAKRMLDLMMRTGPHRVSLSKLERNPHGIDLGPLTPRLSSFLGKRSLELSPKVFLQDVPRLRRKLGERKANDGALELIGRRHLRSNNSWMHNVDRLTKGPVACTLLVHPDDARARGVASGDTVSVQSRTGKVRIVVEVSDEMHRGVVSMPHGWGHNREGVELRVAKSRGGVSVNDLTDETFIDALTGTAGFSGVRVQVTREA